MRKMINRENYVAELTNLGKKPNPQLLAIYGRRRVGKTCLVRHCFQKPAIRYLEVTGLKDGDMHQQLSLFSRALGDCFFSGAPIEVPKDWVTAFELLTTQLIKSQPSELRVLFFDWNDEAIDAVVNLEALFLQK